MSYAPSVEDVHNWAIGEPYDVLLSLATDVNSPVPLRVAARALCDFRPLPLANFIRAWQQFPLDELCLLLPKYLEAAGILRQEFWCYEYDNVARRGHWVDAERRNRSSSPREHVRAAVLLTRTPKPRLTLLERVVKVLTLVFSLIYLEVCMQVLC